MAEEKDPAAVALGRKGGQVTGVAKGFAGMKPEKLQAIQKKAAIARKKKATKAAKKKGDK